MTDRCSPRYAHRLQHRKASAEPAGRLSLRVADGAGRRLSVILPIGWWFAVGGGNSVELLVVNALGQTPSTAGNRPVLIALVKAW
jgi:hypothetical protein